MTTWFEDNTMLSRRETIENPGNQLSVVVSGLIAEDVLTEAENVSSGEFPEARLEQLLPECCR